MALFQPASVEVQPARALGDSRRQIHLPSRASFTLHYPKFSKKTLLSDFYLLPKIARAAGFSLTCASASVLPVSHVPGWQTPQCVSSPAAGPVLPTDPLWEDALPRSPRGRWCASLGDSLSPPPCWRAGCQQGRTSDGWWPRMPPAPCPPPLCLLRGGSSSRGRFRVFGWDAQSKIWLRFGGWEVLLISPAFWV